MPKSKKNFEKEGIEINDGSSSFDLTLLKEAIDNVPTKKKNNNSFDLTSMSLAISSLDRKCSKQRRLSARKREIKSTAAERESTMQRLRTLLMICDKYSCKS
ncbi:unnamed protein product [Eruca vesicaria subsp. sativa]|uniref:Uncharacterized protein n=1 Tax=Eruca vesicaria subsp. sativa TaxID=29727 RepID=A0ABC8LU90_ERUVS|nr:unnamed protein product [Eruca vesicaria subsp. sativa]